MIMRYRWYKIKLPISFESLIKLMRDNPISSEKDKGFSLLHSDSKEVNFNFFWRTKLITTTIDEEGNTASNEIYTLNHQACTILNIEKKYILRLENPGRSSRELLNSLEELTGLGFSTKALSLSDEDTSGILNELEISKLTGIKLTGGIEKDEMVARIDLASKKGIKLDSLSLLESGKYKTDSASYEVMTKGVKGNFSYSPTGLIKISGKLSPLILSLIEKVMLMKK